MEASARVIPLLHKYPVRTDVEEMWEEGRVMLGFDADERFIRKMPHDFAEKVVWGSRYPQHDTMSAHEAIAMLADAKVPDDIMARMMGGNAAAQFGVDLLEPVRG
jgi:predicted TIM-barrel fold metal-dependent hydrolase